MTSLPPGVVKEAATHYQEHGYAILPGVLPVNELETLKNAAARIVGDFDARRYRSVFSTGDRDRGRDRYFMDSAEAVHCFLEEHAVDENGDLQLPPAQAINKIGHALHDRVPEFERFARLPLFAEILGAIGYQQPQLWQSMYIFKQPRIGGEVRWHQDATYLRSSPSVGDGLLDRARGRQPGQWLPVDSTRRPPLSAAGNLRARS